MVYVCYEKLPMTGMKSIIYLLVASFLATNCKSVPSGRNWIDVTNSSVRKGAIPGRMVSVPVSAYRNAFRVYLRIGQCPYVFEDNTIKTCDVKFDGDVTYVAKGSMDVSVSRVQNANDIITYGMGGGGVSVGVLGIISVTPKVKAAVTTSTSRKTLTLMSSYDITKGFVTLQNPRPITPVPEDGSLYLSEIELGGNEHLLVTLEFESEAQKTEVEVSVSFKILFWSITAKMNYIKDVLRVKAKARMQFKSTWREEIDQSLPSLEMAIPVVEKFEAFYSRGPQELRDMSNDNEKIHSVYHFASWNQGPYGSKFNVALINHDIHILTEQHTEMESVLTRIAVLFKKFLGVDQRHLLTQLNETLSEKSSQISSGLVKYHKLDNAERQALRDIYGQDKPPSYYTRQLKAIVKD